MATEYQYSLDNNQLLSDPKNWRSISLGYDFKNLIAGAKQIQTLEYCDYNLIQNFLAVVSQEPCFEYILTLAYRCNEFESYQDFFFTSLLLNRIKHDCDNCLITLPSRRHSIASRLDEANDDELCVFATNRLEMFQSQSGGVITDDQGIAVSRPFVSLLDFINNVSIDVSQGNYINLASLVHADSASYLPAQIIIAPTAVPATDTVITVVGEWEQKYVITIESGSASIEEYLTRIAKAFCYVPDGVNVFMDSWEFAARVADYDISNGVLRVRFYYDIPTVSLTVGGVTPAWFSDSDIRQQHKSSADIFVSGKGLQGNTVCMNWKDIKDLVLKLQGGIIRENGFKSDAISFRHYSELVSQLPTTGFDSEVISEPTKPIKTFRHEWFKQRVSAGSEFRVSEFAEDQQPDRWEWFGIPEPGGVASTGSGVVLRVVVPIDCTGRVTGKVFLKNSSGATANILLQFYIDGVFVDDQAFNTIPDGDTIEQEIGNPVVATFPAGVTDQFSAGQVLEIRWNNSTPSAGIDLSPDADKQSVFTFLCLPGFDVPFLNEDSFYSVPNGVMTDFAGCSGTIDLFTPDKFYTGLGFAISQQLQDLQDYDDTHFITYKEPGFNRARKFPKCFYFGEDATAVYPPYIGNFVTFSYYNAPLQLPNMLMDLMAQIPSKVLFPAWNFTVVVAANGDINYNRNLKNGYVQGTGKKSKIEFGLCAGVPHLVRALNYGSVNIDMCGESGTAIIEDIDINPDTFDTKYTVLI